MTQEALLGIDIGGSGSRLAVVYRGERREFTGPRVEVRRSGDGVARLATQLCDIAREQWPEAYAEVGALGLGSTGLATLVADPAGLASDLAQLWQLSAVTGAEGAVRPAPKVAVAIDAVTAHLGALDGADGAVIALGTGAVALGKYQGSWRRVDGWGHLLGDRGSGSWIGMRALQAAMLAYDGVAPEGAALLDAAQLRFGDPYEWPGQLYARDDRAGVMAAFASEVSALAATDSESARIVAEAVRAAAASVLAALDPAQPPVVCAVGGLMQSERVASGLAEEIVRMRSDARLVPAKGDPLSGALQLAALMRVGELSTEAPFLWCSHTGGERSRVER